MGFYGPLQCQAIRIENFAKPYNNISYYFFILFSRYHSDYYYFKHGILHVEWTFYTSSVKKGEGLLHACISSKLTIYSRIFFSLGSYHFLFLLVKYDYNAINCRGRSVTVYLRPRIKLHTMHKLRNELNNQDKFLLISYPIFIYIELKKHLNDVSLISLTADNTHAHAISWWRQKYIIEFFPLQRPVVRKPDSPIHKIAIFQPFVFELALHWFKPRLNFTI